MKRDWAYYKDFTEEEFAADEYFQQWVLLPDAQSDLFWKSLVQNNPEQRIAISNASKMVQHLVQTGFHIPFLSAKEKQAMKSQIFKQIELPSNNEVAPLKKIQNKKWKGRGLAAAAITALFMMRFFFPGVTKTQGTPAMTSEQTEIKQIKEIMLPDSSLVILNGNSSIRYNSDFATSSKREVVLQGNAYFHVKQTPSLTPFIVHANQLNIQVTGTEFNVNARTKATDVVLTKGKVNVSLQKDQTHAVFMEAGYKLNVDTLNNELITTKTNTDLYTAAWKQREWHFEETRLATVAQLLKEYYGMDVVFTEDSQRDLMITAVVSVNDFQTLINVIERTLNIDIQITNQQLIIINPQSKQL
ncbi:MAG TPA: FecR domain-containing protein [Agriterribacter sp.]|nr:FecR domain-containing protein [Agriterribacter sp.]